jgi:hypothetical protein
MKIGTHTTKTSLTLLTCVVASLLAAPTALADPPQGHRATAVQPDVVERYVASHPAAQRDLVERWVDGRAGQPDLVERYVASRSFDSPSAATTRGEDGFAWSDAGIGALAGLALALLGVGTLLVASGRIRIAHS